MAHFAQIDQNNIVQQVIVIEQSMLNTGIWGDPVHWIQASYNTRGGVYYTPNTATPDPDQSKALRKNFPSAGFSYDPVRNAFIPPKPDGEWVLNEQTCLWEKP